MDLVITVNWATSERTADRHHQALPNVAQLSNSKVLTTWARTQKPRRVWSWCEWRRVALMFDSSAAVSASPRSPGHGHPLTPEEPRRDETATGKPGMMKVHVKCGV